MIYDVPALVALAQRCAPEVATEAVVPLIVTESGGDALAVNINKGPRVRAGSIAEGAAIVRRYRTAGYTVDVGLAQVNSSNFARAGVTVEQAFDPCTNLKLASTVLQEGYQRASRHYAGLDAISATYSFYNTGTLTRGFGNGYVGRVWAAATAMGSVRGVPALPAPPAPPTGTVRAHAEYRADRDAWVVGPVGTDLIEIFK